VLHSSQVSTPHYPGGVRGQGGACLDSGDEVQLSEETRRLIDDCLIVAVSFFHEELVAQVVLSRTDVRPVGEAQRPREAAGAEVIEREELVILDLDSAHQALRACALLAGRGGR
jgi:hypothetical protein